MPRIGPSDVEDTLSDDKASKVDTSDLERAVTIGHAIVEKANTGNYDSDTLEIAEAEAAAHWIVSNKTRQLSQKSVGSAQKIYTGTFGTELRSTTHGQMLTTLLPDVEQATRKTATFDVPEVK